MRNRSFNITLFDLERFESLRETLLKKPNFQYIVCAKEKAPTTGHLHMHAFAQFKTPHALSVKKLLGSHIEKCLGSPEQNYAYKTKDGDIICEEGEMRRNFKWSIKGIKEMDKEQREELPPQLYNIVQKINDKEANDITPNDIYKPDIQVYWLYGESGVGKTRYAMKQIGDRKFNMLKYENGFWHGIGEAKIALYDDFRDTHMKPTELINFIDYYKHPMNIKGGSELNNYMEIYITSIQNPEEIYKNTPEEYKKQWLRRIKEVIQFSATRPCEENK